MFPGFRSLSAIALAVIAARVIEAIGPAANDLRAAELRGRIVDDASGQPVAARIYVQGADGQWYFPRSASPEGSALELKRQAGERSLEMHVTLSAHPFIVDVPPGKVTILVERGKETMPVERVVETPERGLDIEIRLRRWIDMAARGWYSGDTHSHRSVADSLQMVLAEDLNLAFPLSYWVTESFKDPVSANRARLEGAFAATAIPADATHLVYPLNTEYELFTVNGKQHTQGAMVIIGHKKPFELGAPPATPIAEQAHAQGALIDLEKHSWPWSLMLPDVTRADLFELSNNHVWRTEFGFKRWTLDAADPAMNLDMDDIGFTEWGWIDFGFKTYYALLNCGYRLRPTAGTAAGVHPVPLGFGRVYVHQPDGFSFEKWLAGLNAGHSFVTTGPMLITSIDGHQPGDTIEGAPTKSERLVKGEALGPVEIDRIEIVVNGEVAKTLEARNSPRPEEGFSSAFEAKIPLQGTSWIATRVFEKRPDGRVRFAHAAPCYFDVAGQPPKPRPHELAYLTRRMREEIERNKNLLPDDAIAEYERALKAFESRGR